MDRDRLVRRKAGRVRKTCAKCGRAGWYRPKRRMCRWLIGLMGSYICGGRLSDARQPAPPREAAVKRPQDVAAQKLRRARDMVTRTTRKMVTVARSLHRWECQVRHYEKRAAMTDEQVAAEREARRAAEKRAAERRRRTKRGIAPGREAP